MPAPKHTPDVIAPMLPLLRRFARALTGDQTKGDAFVAATLEAIIASDTTLDPELGARAALYKAFYAVWETGATERFEPPQGAAKAEKTATKRLARLTPESRPALLLTAMEEFPATEAAAIMRLSSAEFDGLRREALQEIEGQLKARVLIIEDEPIIAMDIQSLVEGLGHDVVDVVDTAKDAVAAAEATKPELVLADIQLADGSSGVDAVSQILSDSPVPVIFITAYPDRLLTGERPEPTFLITKPFRPEAVEAAISQALFFDERR